ncbi:METHYLTRANSFERASE,putative [Babesia bigemina]|uniref:METHYLTRANSFERASE,putative n=1 Tax=Babesia bigemina TaxID=5866 RepID=A0A061DD66_BABBI|nr:METHYLTRANSFERASE,putative [Babesia bigemina]CDR95995.1 METHYLTRANSFERASE,putative [Babesia bigemina]|eukprot:XP_012768181.1 METHYLTRANSFERASE,putative [Babesia bigemina]
MAWKEVFTFRRVCASFVAANGVVLFSNYRKLQLGRPEYKDGPPPEEKHRIAIFDSIAPTYDLKYNDVHKKLGITATKTSMLKCAKGDVLEVAAGTLESLKLYGAIESLTAVDKSVMMCLEMKRKVEDAKPDFPVTIICGDASDLPFENESFHTLVTSHALCSVEHPERSLDEIARVMKPSGRYFALERGKVYYRYLRSVLEWLKVYPNPGVPWKYGHFENRDPIELKVTDSEIFGYGMNYAIVARRQHSDKITEFANDPTPREGAKIVYQYFPHTL